MRGRASARTCWTALLLFLDLAAAVRHVEEDELTGEPFTCSKCKATKQWDVDTLHGYLKVVADLWKDAASRAPEGGTAGEAWQVIRKASRAWSKDYTTAQKEFAKKKAEDGLDSAPWMEKMMIWAYSTGSTVPSPIAKEFATFMAMRKNGMRLHNASFTADITKDELQANLFYIWFVLTGQRADKSVVKQLIDDWPATTQITYQELKDMVEALTVRMGSKHKPDKRLPKNKAACLAQDVLDATFPPTLLYQLDEDDFIRVEQGVPGHGGQWTNTSGAPRGSLLARMPFFAGPGIMSVGLTGLIINQYRGKLAMELPIASRDQEKNSWKFLTEGNQLMDITLGPPEDSQSRQIENTCPNGGTGFALDITVETTVVGMKQYIYKEAQPSPSGVLAGCLRAFAGNLSSTFAGLAFGGDGPTDLKVHIRSCLNINARVYLDQMSKQDMIDFFGPDGDKNFEITFEGRGASDGRPWTRLFISKGICGPIKTELFRNLAPAVFMGFKTNIEMLAKVFFGTVKADFGKMGAASSIYSCAGGERCSLKAKDLHGRSLRLEGGIPEMPSCAQLDNQGVIATKDPGSGRWIPHSPPASAQGDSAPCFQVDETFTGLLEWIGTQRSGGDVVVTKEALEFLLRQLRENEDKKAPPMLVMIHPHLELVSGSTASTNRLTKWSSTLFKIANATGMLNAQFRTDAFRQARTSSTKNVNMYGELGIDLLIDQAVVPPQQVRPISLPADIAFKLPVGIALPYFGTQLEKFDHQVQRTPEEGTVSAYKATLEMPFGLTMNKEWGLKLTFGYSGAKDYGYVFASSPMLVQSPNIMYRKVMIAVLNCNVLRIFEAKPVVYGSCGQPQEKCVVITKGSPERKNGGVCVPVPREDGDGQRFACAVSWRPTNTGGAGFAAHEQPIEQIFAAWLLNFGTQLKENEVAWPAWQHGVHLLECNTLPRKRTALTALTALTVPYCLHTEDDEVPSTDEEAYAQAKFLMSGLTLAQFDVFQQNLARWAIRKVGDEECLLIPANAVFIKHLVSWLDTDNRDGLHDYFFHEATSAQWFCLFNPKMPEPMGLRSGAPDLPSKWGRKDEAAKNLLEAILIQVRRNLFDARPGGDAVPRVGTAAEDGTEAPTLTGAVERRFGPEGGRNLLAPFTKPKLRLDRVCSRKGRGTDNFGNTQDRSWDVCGRTISQLGWRSWPTEQLSQGQAGPLVTAKHTSPWLSEYAPPQDDAQYGDYIRKVDTDQVEGRIRARVASGHGFDPFPAEWFAKHPNDDEFDSGHFPTCKALAHRLRRLAQFAHGRSPCFSRAIGPRNFAPCLQSGDEIPFDGDGFLENVEKFAPTIGQSTAPGHSGRQLCMHLNSGEIEEAETKLKEALEARNNA